MPKPKASARPGACQPKAGAPEPPPGCSRRRRWLFRLGALLVVPLLVLAVLEGGLRLAGYGYHTSFFQRTRILGREVYVPNDQFGLRFFPPEMARVATPLVMPAEKPASTCRIFLFGESAALGDPEPAYGMGRYLQVLLNERFPGRRFEVVCTAMTAINSHVILPIARECATRQGDVWVVYMGNNEFVGPFGASTVFGPQAPRLELIRTSLALKTTRVGQWLSGLRKSPARAWGGMQMFLDNQVSPEDARKQRVYAHFQRNLDDLLQSARQAGVKVVLCTVASNLKDCAPFASQHAGNLGAGQAEWDRAYQEGTRAEQAGDRLQALRQYQAAAQLDDHFADLQFRLGRCWLELTNHTEARRHLEQARDWDALPFRADRRLNEMIRQTAGRLSSQGVSLADVEATLAAGSPEGIPGKECFHEHVHLNWEGNYQAARAIAEQVAAQLPGDSGSPLASGWASPELCAQRLALTDWDRHRVYEDVQRRLGEPPFTQQSNHHEQLGALRAVVTQLQSRMTGAALAAARGLYATASAAAPEDCFLHAGQAKLLEDAGDLAAALSEWRRVRDLIPFAPGPYYYAGKLLARLGQPEEALQNLSHALVLRPDLAEALDEKGHLLTQQQQAAEGLVWLEKAARLQPANARFCLHRAEALTALHRPAEALEQLRLAVRLQPAYVEAHYRLGVELALQNHVAEAAEQFQAVVQSNPKHTLGHLNLGIALAKLNRLGDAMEQFQTTLLLDPQNRKARGYLEALRQAERPAAQLK